MDDVVPADDILLPPKYIRVTPCTSAEAEMVPAIGVQSTSHGGDGGGGGGDDDAAHFMTAPVQLVGWSDRDDLCIYRPSQPWRYSR